MIDSNIKKGIFMGIKKAIVPVAGLGTRMLPATKAIPKEMLPVVDRPAIQYVVDEALEAGIEHIVFVTGRNKGAIDWNVTLSFKDRGFAAWPRACEALCDAEPSGRCRYFSHSFRFSNCILCASCDHPEIMLGDDTYASFQRSDEDATRLRTGVLAR